MTHISCPAPRSQEITSIDGATDSGTTSIDFLVVTEGRHENERYSIEADHKNHNTNQKVLPGVSGEEKTGSQTVPRYPTDKPALQRQM